MKADTFGFYRYFYNVDEIPSTLLNELILEQGSKSDTFRSVNGEDCRELYLFSDLGRCIGTSDFIKGTMLDAGFGYKINLKNNWRINFKLGYNVNWAEGKNKTIIPNDVDFQYVSFDEIDHTRHSLLIGLGIEF